MVREKAVFDERFTEVTAELHPQMNSSLKCTWKWQICLEDYIELLQGLKEACAAAEYVWRWCQGTGFGLGLGPTLCWLVLPALVLMVVWLFPVSFLLRDEDSCFKSSSPARFRWCLPPVLSHLFLVVSTSSSCGLSFSSITFVRLPAFLGVLPDFWVDCELV